MFLLVALDTITGIWYARSNQEIIPDSYKLRRMFCKVAIDHSLTKDGKVVDREAIRKYHKEVQKWDDIGYHWGVELVGSKYVLQKGRAESKNGAHTIGMNDKSLGICVVGNYDLGEPTEVALNLLADLCALKCPITKRIEIFKNTSL